MSSHIPGALSQPTLKLPLTLPSPPRVYLARAGLPEMTRLCDTGEAPKPAPALFVTAVTVSRTKAVTALRSPRPPHCERYCTYAGPTMSG